MTPNEVKLLPCELLVKQIAEQFCERYGELDFAPWESIVGSIAEAVEGSLSVKALEAGARAMRRRLCGLTFGEAVQLAEVAYPAIRAAMTRPTTVVTDEVVERVALIVGDKLGGHEGLGQVYRRNGDVRWKQSLEIARAALASMPTVVTGEQPGWLPIESAPSGKIVLAWCPKHQLVALERRDGKLTETWAISPSGRADCPEPTHWRPLPEPPAQPGDA